MDDKKMIDDLINMLDSGMANGIHGWSAEDNSQDASERPAEYPCSVR